MPVGVTGNIPGSEPVDSTFESWAGSMSINISKTHFTMKCERCNESISVKLPKGRNPITKASETLVKVAKGRGWDPESGLCPQHK